jgi:hypothetical protein
MYEAWEVSNDIKFIINYKKIIQLIQKFEVGCMHARTHVHASIQHVVIS